MKKMLWGVGAVLLTCASLGLSAPAAAASVTIVPTGLGDDPLTVRYDFAVTNSFADPLLQFRVLFPENVYATLSDPLAPDGWDPIVLPPDPLLPDPGVFDVLALGDGLGTSLTLGGFSVVARLFDGAAAPSSLALQFFSPDFELIGEGSAILPRPVASVPAPAALPLMLTALAMLTLARRRAARGRASVWFPAPA